MSVVLDPRLHMAAVKTAIKAQLGPNDVYDVGQVPGSNGNAGALPKIFVLVSLERRYNSELRLSAQASMTSWRIAVRSVGRTVDETLWAMFRVTTALNENRVTVDGNISSPIQFESDQAPVYDDGRYSGSAFFTFSI